MGANVPEINSRQFQTLIRFLGAHPRITDEQLELALRIAAGDTVRVRSADDIAKLFKAGVVSRSQALSALGMELEAPARLCCMRGCTNESAILEPLNIFDHTYHIPLCVACDKVWKVDAARRSPRRRWSRR